MLVAVATRDVESTNSNDQAVHSMLALHESAPHRCRCRPNHTFTAEGRLEAEERCYADGVHR